MPGAVPVCSVWKDHVSCGSALERLLTNLGHSGGGVAVSLETDDVFVSGSHASDVHPVLGVGPGERVLVEAGAAGQCLRDGDREGDGRVLLQELEDSLHSLEGLEVDEIPGGLLVLVVVVLLVASPGQGSWLRDHHGVWLRYHWEAIVRVVEMVRVG